MVYGVKPGHVWYKIIDPQRCPLRVLFVYGIPQASSFGKKELLMIDCWTYKHSAVTNDIDEQFEVDFLFYADNIVESSFEEWSSWLIENYT